MPSKREETVERMSEKRDRRAEKDKGGSADQRGQKKAKLESWKVGWPSLREAPLEGVCG